MNLEHQTNEKPDVRLPALSTGDSLAVRAGVAAQRDFSGKFRKIPEGSGLQAAPYFSHLDTVARLVAGAGCDSETVAAAYLHDHLEDLPAQWTKPRMAREFGARVADLVDWVTQQDKGLSWEERNEAYNRRLRDAPREAKIISIADKISNIEDLLPLLRLGFRVDRVLKTGWECNSRKYHTLKEIYRDVVPAALFERFLSVLGKFDELAQNGYCSQKTLTNSINLR